MWECIDCGAEFEVPTIQEDGLEICPDCGSEFIEDMEGLG